MRVSENLTKGVPVRKRKHVLFYLFTKIFDSENPGEG